MINFKKFSMVLMSTGALLGVLAVPVVGHADTTQTSTATVNVKPNPTGDGLLSLTSAPGFTFGKGVTTSDTLLKGSATDDLVVSDLTGTASGWNVTAQLKKFSDPNNAKSDPLTGAFMGIGTPTVTHTEDGIAAGNATAENATLIEGGAPTTVMSAASQAGVGVWNTSFAGSTLKILTLPMTTATYTAQIAWTLTSGPTSSSTNTASK